VLCACVGVKNTVRQGVGVSVGARVCLVIYAYYPHVRDAHTRAHTHTAHTLHTHCTHTARTLSHTRTPHTAHTHAHRSKSMSSRKTATRPTNTSLLSRPPSSRRGGAGREIETEREGGKLWRRRGRLVGVVESWPFPRTDPISFAPGAQP